MRFVVSGVVGVLLGAAVLVAQNAAPKPGAEHKRLERMLGQWSYQGEAKASPLGPAGKITSSETCEWSDGGFGLVCRSKGTGPKGPVTVLSVMGYDPAQKTYTYYVISSQGDNFFIRGQVSGNVWTWTDDIQMDGKSMKIRATVTEESPTVTAFKLEVGTGDGQMMVIEEGKSTKKK
jgi:hypothetical protein